MTNTISLKNAKKLKEAAEKYRVELPISKKYWVGDKDNPINYYKAIRTRTIGVYPAYTTNELLEWLPPIIDNNRIMLQKGLMGNQYYIIFFDLITNEEQTQTKADTPQDALCLLAIILIKNKIIK